MNYKVKLNTSNNIHVGVKNATIKKSIEISTIPTNSTVNIDTTNRQNNSVLVYDSTNNIHKYLEPQQIMDLVDGSLNNVIDYGSY
jgi:hypothetical protein